MKTPQEKFNLRKKSVRNKVFGTSERPRLSVYRGHKHIYAQLINDEKGQTVAHISTLSPDIKGKLKASDNIPAAKMVGEMIAKKAIEKGIKKVVFDRRGYLYHGRIKALADAARQAGLEF
ncbi:MAG: 50S ribosomal protein L18 [Elusimicrobiota bacterium]